MMDARRMTVSILGSVVWWLRQKMKRRVMLPCGWNGRCRRGRSSAGRRTGVRPGWATCCNRARGQARQLFAADQSPTRVSPIGGEVRSVVVHDDGDPPGHLAQGTQVALEDPERGPALVGFYMAVELVGGRVIAGYQMAHPVRALACGLSAVAGAPARSW